MSKFLFVATWAFSVATVLGEAPFSLHSSPSISLSSGYNAPSEKYGAPPRQEYGPPQVKNEYGPPQVKTEYGPPPSQGGYGGGGYDQGGQTGGQIHRHVYIHVAPDDATDSQSRVIRVPGGQDKHVNIIFVKAPSASSQQNTEVILPDQEQQKTIVYVLVKKGDNNSDVKIRGPSPTRPPKPEVFFIRYKNEQGQTGGYGPPAYTPPQPTYGPPSNSYGAPTPV